MTKVTSPSACPEHGPYLLVLGWEAPATGLQPPIIVPHVLPDLPVLLPLLLTACRGRAVTEERSTASPPNWCLKRGAEGEGNVARTGEVTQSKPNPAVKTDVGNQRQKNSAEKQTQAVLICHLSDVASQVIVITTYDVPRAFRNRE